MVVARTVREALNDWFIDVWRSLKARLPQCLFKSKACFVMISGVISNLSMLKSSLSSCFRTRGVNS